MVEFESLFRESRGKPILYHGETLLLMDRVAIPARCHLSVFLRSTDSEWPQAIRLKTKGTLVSRITGVEAPNMVLWAKDMREPHSYDCLSRSGKLLVWNAWAEPRCALEAWVRGAAMRKETLAPNHFRYRCNDGHVNDDFTDIIFDLILE